MSGMNDLRSFPNRVSAQRPIRRKTNKTNKTKQHFAPFLNDDAGLYPSSTTPATIIIIMPLPLPEVHSPVDCASFSHTVIPFLSQLSTLPVALQEAGKDVNALKEIYLATNPFITALGFCLVLSAFFLVWSEINRNYSQVDRCWSLLPTVYNVHYAVWSRMVGIKSHSLDTIAAISVIWSVGLPYIILFPFVLKSNR